MSSPRSRFIDGKENARKRVCKACDRCRLKKSKCDGASPCSRCKADNAICAFGKRKKPQNKVYPKGYVEMLEQQQAQLVAGLQKLCTRLQSGQGWPGQPLREARNGHPLTHDILKRLDLLREPSKNSSNYEGLEEDSHSVQHDTFKRGTPTCRRHESVSSDSEPGHTMSSLSYCGTPTTNQSPCSDTSARNNAPLMPPINDPCVRRTQIVTPINHESSIISSNFLYAEELDPSPLSSAAWMNDSITIDESVDFSKPIYGFENFNNYGQNLTVDPYPTDAMMLDWNDTGDLDISIFLQNLVGV